MVASMSNSQQREYCSLDDLSNPHQEQERLNIIKKLELLNPDTIPICEEATQMVARFLEIPICFLGLMLQNHLWLKSAVGLAKLGFMNPIAQERKILKENSFCNHVINTKQILIIHDTLADPLYANHPLVQDYGIRSYLGIPLITTTGYCLGTLAVMDLAPHSFNLKDQEFLALTARWCIRELESQYYSQNGNSTLNTANVAQSAIDSFQAKFFREVTQNLRAPLTNIIGMSRVLKDETYGSLNQKQKNYLDIIYKSGHKMTSLMSALAEINLDDEELHIVKLSPADPNMIAKEIIYNLENWVELELISENNLALYILDRKKLRQAIYYLIISLLGTKDNNEKITINLGYEAKTILITISFSVKLNDQTWFLSKKQQLDILWQGQSLKTTTISKIIKETDSGEYYYNQLLQLFLSCYLVELQKGEILVEACQDFGYKYILKLPKILAK
ncbi:MAG: GAF domain-containing sensor histidine kinase [Gloeocapsa sp. DLM2.Bin57]|nr:MAG: GAF domain-containing sensor histidine kinase [Gloeocapsa sp. DLM2.Bin57]